MEGEDLLYKIALTKIKKVGVLKAKLLVSYCGGVKEVFEKSQAQLQKIPNIGSEIAKKVATTEALSQAEDEIKFLEKENISTCFYLDKNYPSRLKVHEDSPIMMYYRGESPQYMQRSVGIVGTRKPSEIGKLNCEKLVEDLKPLDPVIISGMAYGIDAMAHKSALKYGLKTVGVLGHGLHMMYPAQHKNMLAKMLENHGTVITEYDHQSSFVPQNFPNRNRIIAGMSDAIVVVESARKGGSIISAVYANNYNKDVFAFPGRVQDEKAQGCNMLIKQHKAALIESAADIAYIMRWEESEEIKNVQAQLFINLSPTEEAIVDQLKQKSQCTIDQLHYATQIPQSKLSSILLNLEFQGVVKSLPGKKYILYK